MSVHNPIIIVPKEDSHCIYNSTMLKPMEVISQPIAVRSAKLLEGDECPQHIKEKLTPPVTMFTHGNGDVGYISDSDIQSAVKVADLVPFKQQTDLNYNKYYLENDEE